MSKKIFELAKELDMRPLNLVDELRAKGYSVRNHMSSLTEKEVEEICAEFDKVSENVTDTKKKKKVKKKTAKKATKKAGARKKKIVTVASKSADGSSGKKVSVRKKVTLRKKVQTKDIKGKEEQEKNIEELSKDEKVETSISDESSSNDFDEVPRLNKFTSIYVPKSEDPWKQTEASEKPSPDATKSVESDKGKIKESESRRRLGDLASMISKKRQLNRAQVLQETRSEDELKSYSALSGMGRPIYTTIKKRKQYTGPVKETSITEVKDSKRVVKVHGAITAVNFAKKLKIKFKDMVDRCLDINLLVAQDDYLGISLASYIAELYDYRVENISFQEEKVLGKESVASEEEQEKLPNRNPIVTIMGHVDHGKTTLLDFIRNANVVSDEAGGITQHIAAYSVETKNGKGLTFLDTPGHLAFSSMRERGAGITDIVVLVVAADDGVMPQTRESIRHVQNSQVPLVVAINKMDKEGVNPDRIKQELTELEVTPEEWGGNTQIVPISALKGEGIDDLLDAIVLQSEIMQLKADPDEKGEGVILESRIEVGRGSIATLLVQRGTLKKGDTVVVGETYGRVRSMFNHKGEKIDSAGPSTPVQVLGLADAPQPGDELNVVKNEREAKKISMNRLQERKMLETASAPKKQVALEDFFTQAQEEGEDDKKELKIIVRSDVQGSYEAIRQSLEAMSNTEIGVKVIGGGVGPINDNDVALADFSKGIILGFNMRPVTSARQLAENKGIDVKTYSIIYELINDVEMALEGMLKPTVIEHYVGRAEAKETFTVPKVGVISGSIVIDGSIKMGCQTRLLREGKILFDGKISSLKRFKDDVKEVKSGLECGIGLENYNDIKIGDVFEVYTLEHKRRTLAEVKSNEEKVETSLKEPVVEEGSL